MTDNPDQHSMDARQPGEPTETIIRLSDYQQPKAPPLVTFHRRELDALLKVYGQMVAAGEWRDYAIDHLRDRAVFSVFRRASEVPLYRIEKVPRLARRQGAFAVVAASGMILKRGHELRQVLRVLEPKAALTVVSGA